MQLADIEKHLSKLKIEPQLLPQAEETKDVVMESDNTSEEDIQSVPVRPGALVHDVIHFDLKSLDFLHKLGEGMLKFSLILLTHLFCRWLWSSTCLQVLPIGRSPPESSIIQHGKLL